MRRALGLAILLAFLPVSKLEAQFSSVRVQVIDVGQADGILIRTPNTHWILIDAGQGTLLADSLPSHFGVDTIDLMIASHRHKDHIGAMDNVVDRIPTLRFVGDTTDYASAKDDDRLRDSLAFRQVELLGPGPDTLEIDGVRFIVLPRPPQEDANENNNSIVVRLDFGEFSMLFAGDAQTKERDWFVDNDSTLLDVDVLKASHHGGDNGTSARWLNAITPSDVVISAGVNATYKHPQPDAVAAYDSATDGRVFCTNRHGTVRVYGFADGRIRVTRQRVTDKNCTYDGTQY